MIVRLSSHVRLTKPSMSTPLLTAPAIRRPTAEAHTARRALEVFRVGRSPVRMRHTALREIIGVGASSIYDYHPSLTLECPLASTSLRVVIVLFGHVGRDAPALNRARIFLGQETSPAHVLLQQGVVSTRQDGLGLLQ